MIWFIKSSGGLDEAKVTDVATKASPLVLHPDILHGASNKKEETCNTKKQKQIIAALLKSAGSWAFYLDHYFFFFFSVC